MSTRGKGSTGLIEADVSVCADSKDLEVNAAGIANRLVIVCCGLVIVAGPDVGAVRGALGEINAINEETVNEVRIALGVVFGQANVFVKIKRLSVRERNFAGLVTLGQLIVQGQRSRARRKTKYCRRLALQKTLNAIGCDDGNIFGRGQDGNPHWNSSLMLGSRGADRAVAARVWGFEAKQRTRLCVQFVHLQLTPSSVAKRAISAPALRCVCAPVGGPGHTRE